ncbi:MAG: glycosyl hydrolase [Eubacterium sp.]
MNKFKKITSMLLAIALVISSICITGGKDVSAATDANQWKTTAITSPKQDSLVGAGYIDIKWDNTLENVSQYKVYVDGSLKKTVAPTTSTTMSCEFYTTSVSAHNAYIIATLKNGTNVQTGTRRFYVTKKGICVNTKDMGAAVDPASMNIGWYYNWGYQSFKDTNYKNTKFYDTEFVPMIWGEPTVEFSQIFSQVKAKGYKYMLAYNEPDLQWESNISPSTMLLRWNNEFIKYKGSMRLGSPAISTAKPLMESDDWWAPFWNGLSASAKANMTFIAVHKYYENYNEKSAAEFLMLIDETYEKYKKPIWITEFALWNADKNNAKSNANAQEFLKIVCKGLNERSYVERYSWFCPNLKENSASASSLYDYDTGALTTIGKMYAQIGNPAGYKAKTYGVASGTTVSTTPAACIAKQETTLYNVKAKKKAFKYDIKEVKRAAGYQIQYGTKKSMKGAKTKTVKKLTGTVKIKFTKKQKKQIKKKPKKYKTIKYYVRVRAYKTIGGKNMYYKWSAKEKVKVKTK